MTRSQFFSSLVLVTLAMNSTAFVGPAVRSVVSNKSMQHEIRLFQQRGILRMSNGVDTEVKEQQQQQQTSSPLGIFNYNTKESSAVMDDTSSSTAPIESSKQVVVGQEQQEEPMSETQKLMAKVKDAGTAGIISYALWELGFWFISIPVCIIGYQQVTGHWPDLSNSDDQAKLGAEAFAFVNFARFAVPLRIGLALSTTPWIQQNIVDKFLVKKEETGTITNELDEPVMNEESTFRGDKS